MNANGARFWSLSEASRWTATEDPDRVRWSDGALRLASAGEQPVLDEDDALAEQWVDTVPAAIDGRGTITEVPMSGDQVITHHPDVLDATLEGLPAPITGVAYGVDGIATVCAAGAIAIRDTRVFADDQDDEIRTPWRLLQADTLGLASFSAFRVAPRPEGGAWVLDRQNRQLVGWSGTPRTAGPRRHFSPATFRPRPEAPETLDFHPAAVDFHDEDPVALAVSPQGQIAVLVWTAGDAAVYHLTDEGRLLRRAVLAGVQRPFSLTFVSSERVAVMVTDASTTANEPLVYVLQTDDPELLPVGERYPLRSHDGSAFVVSPDLQARYPTDRGPRRLVSLSLPRRATVGRAAATLPLDSRSADTCWHRLYIEAMLPASCGIRIELAATDAPAPPADDASWFPHLFGDLPEEPGAPRAAWSAQPCELPNHPGRMNRPGEPDRSGLFTVLVQASGRRSRRLRGRYLHVRATLLGNGRRSPALYAFRAWGARFSYVRAYLPELFHEDPLIEASLEAGPATQADFFERFVAMFEGVLTPIEDQVAEAWQYAHPQTVPAEALPWLASWTGFLLDADLPEAIQRSMLEAAPRLAQWRGTRRGLEMALELLTEGGVSRGEIVVLEDWRLRRTWATILGADLAPHDDALLQGMVVSTNSIVGETLVLGDEHRREFLALFGEDLLAPQSEQEQDIADAVDAYLESATQAEEDVLIEQITSMTDLDGGPGIDGILRRLADRHTVERFFARSAHRATVLVLDENDALAVGRIRRLVEQQAPAGTLVRVRTASHRFIVGLTSLIGVETRLGQTPAPQSVRLGLSKLGGGDRVSRPPALHPKLEG